jgi:type II secretory pathway component PulF
VAGHLDAGARLSEALAAVPEFLPPRFNAMLRVGLETVEPSRLASLCSRGLTDARSQVLGAMNYLMVMVFAVGPVACCVFSMLVVFVLPKYQAIMQELDVPPPPLLQWLLANAGLLIGVMASLSLLLLLAMVLYVGGPRLSRKLQRTVFPWTDRVAWALPWKRNRLRRDFIASLAASLDAGVPEARAVSLAADATASTVAMRKAGRMTRGLGQGRSLLDVLGCMDRSKELEWRVRNAVHGSTGFAPALRGWIEALDARAFRQEQVAAQVATTALVLWFGLIVGLIVVGVFQPLIAIINTAALW